jgi:hypothetical protein
VVTSGTECSVEPDFLVVQEQCYSGGRTGCKSDGFWSSRLWPHWCCRPTIAEMDSGLAGVRPVGSRSTVLGAASIDDARQGYR